MRKLTAILLCFMLALSMTLLTGCGDKESAANGTSTSETASKPPQELIVGQWQGKIDMTEYLNKTMASDDMAEIGLDITFKDIAVVMNLNINADGTIITSVDETSVDQMASAVIDQAWDSMSDMMEATYGMSIEEIVELSGMTEEEAKEEALGGMELSSEALGLKTTSGSWELAGNKLYTWEAGEEKDETEYMVVEVSENKLVWSDVVTETQDEQEDSLVVQELLPIEFTK